MSGLVIKNNNELWFNNNKLSTSTGTKGLYLDSNRNLFFNNAKIASGNLSNSLGLHLINNELAYNGVKFSDSMQLAITNLFANNEQGFAFDFNDLSTMYQDAAGTIPVTGVGQPVGKVLDKSGRGNHATQATSAKRPILQQNTTTGAYYLTFDGVDDCLVTGNVDFSSKDEINLFIGVRKLSDSGTGIVCELSTAAESNQKAFALFAPSSGGSNHYNFRSYGTAGSATGTAAISNMPAPHSSVLIARGKITSAVCTLTINRVTTTSTAISQGTSNYGNYPIYIGMRAGTSLAFNGHIYSLIGIARLATPTEITNTENIIAKTVGVTL